MAKDHSELSMIRKTLQEALTADRSEKERKEPQQADQLQQVVNLTHQNLTQKIVQQVHL